MSPALNGSSAIRRFEGSDAIEIRDGITFDFYTGLPHICIDLNAIPHVTKRETDSGWKSGCYAAILSGKEDWSLWSKVCEI